MSERICAVIVTYFPDVPQLHALVDNLRSQVNQVLVVDNSGEEHPCPEFQSCVCVEVICNSTNRGVATAHNQGIQWAKERFFTHVLLMDQDSLPETDMVAGLLSVEKKLLALGKRVAAVGPTVLDAKTRIAEPLLAVQGGRVLPQQCSETTGYCEVAYLISSGCLIRQQILSETGLMDEGLFIDLVDVEWGLRCRKKGFVQYVSCGVQQFHSIGVKKDIAPGYYTITRHSPLRMYYQYRNFLLIARRYRCSPFGWFFYHLLRRLLPRILLFPLLFSPRLQYIIMICRGVRDGIAGVDGKYNRTDKVPV